MAYLNNLFRLQTIAGKYSDANKTIILLRAASKTGDPQSNSLLYIQHELFNRAKQYPPDISFKIAFTGLFYKLFKSLDDKSAYHIYTAFMTRNGIGGLKSDFDNTLTAPRQTDSLNINDALALCRNYYMLQLYQNIEPVARPLINDDVDSRYSIKNVLIKTGNGASISAIVTLQKDITGAQPAVLQYTIYADSTGFLRALEPAAYGYAAIMAYTRGKGQSPDKIVPYEDDGKDANDVISWISKQPWCNGKIGMYGGSYNGFTQWAAAKYANPALKTIVPYVAAIPGLGLPMENNVFLNANYGWAFYTTDNKYLDNKIYNDPNRWNAVQSKWYNSGKAYNKIDSIDGMPNPWLQRWLKHPDYDKYWQDMVPYKGDFSKINIPVLNITGYYDDGQISAMHYLIEHTKYNPKEDDYLIIGPYDHFGAQQGGVPVLRDYTVDPVALISTRDITFQWLDHILKGGPKPALLKDKINYEVMGTNKWEHAPSLQKMANEKLTLYLTNIKENGNYDLSPKKPLNRAALNQAVDLADRKTANNRDYYPFPIIKKTLDHSDGLFFISKPFDKPVSVNGMFSGELKAKINKKDMDIGLVLYEVTPQGEYFELSYFLGRASYANDMETRKLLHPGKIESIPFTRSRLVSRQLSKGSRLLVVLNIDKNPFAQINYGTGKDVSTETIKDAGEPLQVKWYNDSYIEVPVWR